MPEWTICPYCHLKHTARPSGVCPRCGQSSSSAQTAAPVPQSAPPPTVRGPAPPYVQPATSRCQSCGAQQPTQRVEFRQNIGLLIMRLTRKVAGQLCPDCIEKHFWSTTLVTLFAGWWGLISLFVTPVFLLLNLASYVGAVWALARRERAARIREPFGSTSLALGVVTLPAAGFCGMVSLVGLVLGLIGLFARKPDGASRVPALLGIGCNAVPVLLIASLLVLSARGTSRTTSSSSARGASQTRSVDASGFDAANRQIMAFENGQEAFGNTPEAVELARKFSTILKVMTKIGFTSQRKDEAISLTQGHVLTYVEMRADTVCFLAHVPELRAYRGDVRGTLLDLAWNTARESTRRARTDRDVKLAVALRGMMLYGAIAIGPASGEKPQMRDFEGSPLTDPLNAFFTGPPYVAPSPTPSPLAPTPSATAETPAPTTATGP
jgi:hypothetical protein